MTFPFYPHPPRAHTSLPVRPPLPALKRLEMQMLMPVLVLRWSDPSESERRGAARADHVRLALGPARHRGESQALPSLYTATLRALPAGRCAISNGPATREEEGRLAPLTASASACHLRGWQVPRIGFSCPNLWCMLNQHLQSLQHMQFWVRVPLQSGEGKDTKDGMPLRQSSRVSCQKPTLCANIFK